MTNYQQKLLDRVAEINSIVESLGDTAYNRNHYYFLDLSKEKIRLYEKLRKTGLRFIDGTWQ